MERFYALIAVKLALTHPANTQHWKYNGKKRKSTVLIIYDSCVSQAKSWKTPIID